MAKIEKKTKRYPSDLTDEEWARIEPFLSRASKAGRPIEVDLREVLNAIRYMARSGGGWRMLPNDFPPWQTVGTVRNLVCGAIMTPMEGDYGNQERHPGRFTGGA